jgi:pilus assembly protein CpaF
LLADPGVTDICLNGALGAYADRGRGPEPVTDARWHEEGLKTWVLARLSEAGRGWDARHPFADAALTSGHRLHAVFPPVARTGVHVSLRRLPTPGPPRWSASPLFDTLSEAVRRGESVLISGATGSGKTTLLTDLLAEIPADERILALEDTPELAPRHPHFVSLTSRPANADGCGEVTLRALLRQALRMRPDRIVLGECRGPEVLDLLQALNTGHRGAMATLHASSPREAIKRVELLCLLASPVPLPALRELLALGIRWVAQVERRGPGRVISELWRVEGREGETILMRPLSGHPDRPALI